MYYRGMMRVCPDYAVPGSTPWLFAGGLLWLIMAAPADAAYRFDSAEDYLTDAAALPAWAATLEQHKNERQVLQRCLENDGNCEKRLRSLRHVLLKGADLAEDKQLSLTQLQALHAGKTGALIRVAVQIGALFGDAKVDAETYVLLTEFATRIGLAFQIIDDVLDVTQSTETLG